MSVRTRLVLALSALILIPVFFMPIWSITLTAPQYPDGIGMYIWLDDVTGHERHDIQNINILNHYVGMKEIHAEDFWEFDVMPYVFGALIALGLLAAAGGKRWMLWSWVVIFVLVGIGGMIDFYYWGYQYGHDLDPQAAIKIPDMTYQPPLIGTDQLLNIHAASWPYWGALFIGASLLGGFGALAYEYRQRLRALYNRFASSEDKQPTPS